VRLLLDSHTLVWSADVEEKLSTTARAAIADAENLVCVSAASVWELAIKIAARRLQVPGDLTTLLAESRFATVSITADHALAAAALPRHHGDPFDRMLIAQAQLEGLTIVTRDPAFSQYDVSLLAA
jgi:PIN domain nuclease of toxin-antitoxin system